MIQQVVDFLASLFADTETILHPDAVTLPDFTRSIQLDDYSCGAKSVYCILQYYDRQCSADSVEEQLHTDEVGTSVSDIKRVFRRYHLNYRTLRKPGLWDLKAAIDDDCPILITLNDGEHYTVVYGYSSSHIFLSNPSLNILTGYGSIRCAIPNAEFRKIWDRWAVIVSE
jgi:ABC-type bacteriocin/lantibiotic exporter with double-glycine peptidase domain